MACFLQIARALGEVSDEEKKILTARINELNAEHEEVVQLERGLQAQCKQVKDDLKQALRSQADLSKRLAEVQSKIDEILLQNRRCAYSSLHFYKTMLYIHLFIEYGLQC
jgi:chromosome segregation ATPase